MLKIRQIVRGYRRRARGQWETTRWLIWSISSMLGGNKYDSPEDMCQFGWEKEVVNSEEEAERVKEMLEEARKYNDNLGRSDSELKDG